jgi:hypothetical protein
MSNTIFSFPSPVGIRMPVVADSPCGVRRVARQLRHELHEPLGQIWQTIIYECVEPSRYEEVTPFGKISRSRTISVRKHRDSARVMEINWLASRIEGFS